MTDPEGRPSVRVKPHGCQPRANELNERVRIRKQDGSTPAPGEMARAALRPMNVVEDSDA